VTSGLTPGSGLIVVGIDAAGAEVARCELAHGDDPTRLLAVHGWEVRQVQDVVRNPVENHLMTMTFVVERSLDEPQTVAPSAMGVRPRRDVDLVSPVDSGNQVMAQGDAAVQHQRVAAYAVVTSSRGILMTQFSDRTGAPGLWGLPGGGLEAGEAPDRAVLREVWEESGQVIEVTGLAFVGTSHWVGPAPSGRLEDYHAVRVIYRAVCPEPTEPVVHDVGGTTASAAWLPLADLDQLALTSDWRSIMRDVARLDGSAAGRSVVVMAPDETDGPDRHHHDPDADDRARPQP